MTLLQRVGIGMLIAGLFAIAVMTSADEYVDAGRAFAFAASSTIGGGVAAVLLHVTNNHHGSARVWHYARFGAAGICAGFCAGLSEILFGEPARMLGFFSFLGFGVAMFLAVYAAVLAERRSTD